MKPLVVASNMFNEIEQLPEWIANMKKIADAGILIVDNGSTDGTIGYAREHDVIVIEDDIIIREGYGPARNHLRMMSKKHFPDAHWCLYLDADERIHEDNFHYLRYLKDNLIEQFDVVALPRKNMLCKDSEETKNDLHVHPDYQARMSRLDSPIKYVRKLHEQVTGHNAIFAELTNPVIRHYHRSTDKEKRDYIGRVCHFLQTQETDYSLPKHHKHDYYEDLYKKFGLQYSIKG